MSGYSRNVDAPDQGPSRSGYHDNLFGGITHPKYGPGVGHGGITAGYDPYAPRQYPVGPTPNFEDVYSAQLPNLNSPHNFDFVPQQSPRLRFMAQPSSSQDSASVWNVWAGSSSYSLQSASESRSHCSPGGFDFHQGMRHTTLSSVSSSQRSASLQNPSVGPYSTTRITRKRRALVIGTNYPLHPDPRYRLQCCTGDACRMADFLHDKLGFARNDIRIITDENPGDLPKKENIIAAMKALVRDAQPGDSFFFYFSGHGIQIKDTDGDESDGLDECICAMDYRGDDPYPDCNTSGLIVDDTMHDLMVKPLPPQCRLTAIYDCCHSGTILDLPVIYNASGAAKPFIHQDGPWILTQKMSSADVVSLSASKDNQEAAESRQGGALQLAFIDSVSRFGGTLTYRGLIRNMRDYMWRHGFEQKPQLSSSHKIDTNLRFVT